MFAIEVEFEDGSTHTADVDGRDIRVWEVEARKSFLTSDLTYTALTDLARLALKRTGALDLGTGEFDQRCVSVKEVPTVDGDPT